MATSTTPRTRDISTRETWSDTTSLNAINYTERRKDSKYKVEIELILLNKATHPELGLVFSSPMMTQSPHKLGFVPTEKRCNKCKVSTRNTCTHHHRRAILK